VIKSQLRLLYQALYADDQLVKTWLETDHQKKTLQSLVQSVYTLLEADDSNIEDLDYFWLIIHLLSIASDQGFGHQYLVRIENDLFSFFRKYIMSSFGESIDYDISSSPRTGALAGSISIILQTADMTSSSVSANLLRDKELRQCLRLILENVKQANETRSESIELAVEQLELICSSK
jgi:hypothetical protein